MRNIMADQSNIRQPLNMRPNDLFSIPIQGDYVSTPKLLLRVRRKKKPQQQEDTVNGAGEAVAMDTDMDRCNNKTTPEFEATIVGRVKQTCRFRAMSDFQYMADNNHPITHLCQAMRNDDVTAMRNFNFKFANEMNSTHIGIPPPFFSRIETPINYGFRQLIYVNDKESSTRPGTNVAGVGKRYTRWQNSYSKTHVIQYTAASIPDRPDEEVVKSAADIDKSLLDRAEQLFKERPIWTSRSIHCVLNDATREDMRVILRYNGYVMMRGPWRGCYIRLGYDPRIDKEARKYQLLDTRPKASAADQAQKNTHAIRLNTIGRLPANSLTATMNRNTNGQTPGQPPVFDGKHDVSGIISWQYCDITDQGIRKILDAETAVASKCDERNGWYRAEAISGIRRLYRLKRQAIRLGKDANAEEEESIIIEVLAALQYGDAIMELKYSLHSIPF
ncbi:RNA polymerase III transcription factor IIIC subunit-domain-containing protein [Syncephalis fuscata]|nr:RNA polymerase III transcription factor IIIC subunit-domain-containing protein [Syncephalis fuscata]